ncbi:hypothetical protein OS493_010781 [Desmophyllum pertusum]|uniref:Uncharacterized protein n=1 Tax=Desmophyllum pertusum TaxID=174260 RepID=A0A9W9ZE66_9CNID|nr:hypothetical protein OS493_010781 [Desmophyllum pertusum]
MDSGLVACDFAGVGPMDLAGNSDSGRALGRFAGSAEISLAPWTWMRSHFFLLGLELDLDLPGCLVDWIVRGFTGLTASTCLMLGIDLLDFRLWIAAAGFIPVLASLVLWMVAFWIGGWMFVIHFGIWIMGLRLDAWKLAGSPGIEFLWICPQLDS